MNTLFFSIASILLLTGCATISPSAGFSSVRTMADSRIGASVHWNQGTPEDSAVAKRVGALLSQELTPEAAVQIALLNNRRLQATYENLGVAQADLVQAGLLRNPLLSGTLRAGLQGVGTGYEIGLVQEFLSILQIPLRKRIAAAALEQVNLSVAQEVFDLSIRTRKVFYELQGALQTQQLLETITEATSLSAEIAKRQYEAGNIPELNLMTEQSLYEQAKLDLTQAQSHVLELREVLSAHIGVWGTQTAWTIGPRLPDVPVEEIPLDGLESAAIEQRLDLLAARQDILVSAHQAGLTRASALVPALEVGAAYEKEPSGDRSWNPSLGIRIPVFDQGRALKASARARVRQSQEHYAAMAVDIRADIRRLYARMNLARTRAEHLRTTVIPLRTKIAEETQLHYNGMQVGVFQLLEAKRGQIAAGQQYVDVLEDYWVTRTELERAVGGRLSLRSN